MIQKLLLNTRIIWMIFTKVLKNKVRIKKEKTLIVCDDMIAYIHNNKKFNEIVTDLFIRGRKLNMSPVFITHSLF